MTGLANKHLLLGIGGGIAAYKTAFLARLLVKAGAEVRVVMTRGAQAFVQPLTFQALTGHPVHTQLLDEDAEAGMGHIELARWADLVIIAPATADLMARLAAGRADDLLTTLCLATSAPVLLAPAMNQAMWQHPATQGNQRLLKELGYQLIPPAEGDQACGDSGPGRLPEPEELLQWLEQACSSLQVAKAQSLVQQPQAHQPQAHQPLVHQSLVHQPLAKELRISITAGPTREPLDPVRYLSNHSSGKMGFALAQAAAELGAEVRLISGPVQLETPPGVKRVDVGTAEQMLAACLAVQAETDLFIACAAVADYRAEQLPEHKIKKQPGQQAWLLRLVENPDILATLATTEPRPFCVGFAAETRQVAGYARSKLERKNLDAIIANDVSDPEIGFGSDENRVSLIYRQNQTIQQEELPQASKQQLAFTLLEKLIHLYRLHKAHPAQDTQPL